MFLLTSVVPPSIVLARLRSMPRTSYGRTPPTRLPAFSHAMAPAPSNAVATSWIRWLRPPWWTLPIELSGPGGRPARDLGPHPLVRPLAYPLLTPKLDDQIASQRIVPPTRSPRQG